MSEKCQEGDSMVKVSADSATRQDLDIMQETISEENARRVVEKLANNPQYKVSHSNDKLVIQRFLRD
jgi:hypothetical protein